MQVKIESLKSEKVEGVGDKPVQTISSSSLSGNVSDKIPGMAGMANDETYRQINSVSFQQNFKMLIGHYKTL